METILTEVIAFFIGAILTWFFTSGYGLWIKLRYNGWHVRLLDDENGTDTLVIREVSPRKVRQVKEEPSDLAVYAKGIASPYKWIKSDMLATRNMVRVLDDKREIVIDLSKDKRDDDE